MPTLATERKLAGPSERRHDPLLEWYTREEGLVFLTGVQALVRVPIDHHRTDRRRGLKTATFISGYEGSPLGGYDLELQRIRSLLVENNIHFIPGLNEELAATAVFGSQIVCTLPGAKYDGVIGIWYGKAPGLDRATDAIRHANLVGVHKHGGALLLVGDDPISKSSTVPSASEMALADLAVPTLYPGNVQEVLDLGLHGIMLSRASGLVTSLKVVTNVADGTGTVEVAPDRIAPVMPVMEVNGQPYEHRQVLQLAAPYNLEMERNLHEVRLELARLYARENGLNRVVVDAPNAWFGIVAAGKTYYDLRQALERLGLDDDALRHYGIRILQVRMIFPLDPVTIHDFAKGLREVLVVEEKRPFLETAIKEVLYGSNDRPAVVGKTNEDGSPLLPIHGELDPDIIARAVARRLTAHVQIPSVVERVRVLESRQEPVAAPVTVIRTPYFCSGCPHNRSTVLPEGAIAGAGIGCHGLALLMNRNHVTITQMGGEGAQWIGMAPFTERRHIFQNLGDGTYFHSGTLAINFAVAAGVNITFKLLYNSAVAMTGGQAAVGALSVPAITRRLEAEGVRKIIITTDDPNRYRGVPLASIAEVRHRDDLLRAQEELAATPGVTVLIHDQECATELQRKRKRGKAPERAERVVINERVCEGCGDCSVKSNCLSIWQVDTEFGTKARIHQSSCNQDFSCLAGDCPSFVTVVPAPRNRQASRSERAIPAAPCEIPEPVRLVRPERFAARLIGIGGTGVVTVNQILGTAAFLDGWRVAGLNQTGLSQKGGPVVSDLKIFAPGTLVTNKVAGGEADLYLAFDILAAADPRNLIAADPKRTIAVVSTSQVPTGHMVLNPQLRFPNVGTLREMIERATRRDAAVFLDTWGIAETLFGDHRAAGMILLGAAYQSGALPISARAIEEAIRLNNVKVEMNLQAFRWGRIAVASPETLEGALRAARASALSGDEQRGASPSPVAASIVESTGASGELRRLLSVRVADLIAYQNVGYARSYAEFVRKVAEVEAERTPGGTRVAEAVARNLYKLMAYKDEYEVARLHLEALDRGDLTAGFGRSARVYFYLHPPFLRAIGLRKKLRVGAWFVPVFRLLRTLKFLRGTPFNLFGYTRIRRLERALINEYRRLIEQALAHLSPETYETVVAIAELPDVIRGYEERKLASVERFRAQARELMERLTGPRGTATPGTGNQKSLLAAGQ